MIVWLNMDKDKVITKVEEFYADIEYCEEFMESLDKLHPALFKILENEIFKYFEEDIN